MKRKTKRKTKRGPKSDGGSEEGEGKTGDAKERGRTKKTRWNPNR